MIEDRRIQTTTRVVIDDNGVVVLLGYQYYHIDTQTRYVVRIDTDLTPTVVDRKS